MRFSIRVYDNFHYQNEDEAYDKGPIFGARAALNLAKAGWLAGKLL